ncbi:hypothetical protein GIB67_031526 [Kingdonia uniflora]|uniref:GDP-L-fucose synthase n=1 Tax=Kingdonia uniflora TaxID=39325 RepID=A0A7J7MN69_9MAGN|nr:hypothetical protein GIB67_031526 [Kingdonia uniflora]
MEDKSAKIFIAGHNGLVGSAIVRKLRNLGFTNLILRSHHELDLTRQFDVETFFDIEKPQFVILAAAKVGGIHANNTYPADFISINLQIQTNVIHSSYINGVKKIMFLGSSCIYPKLAEQPIVEEALLTGPLEPTNEWYAIAKIAGIKMCQAYRLQYKWDAISLMPTNLYGANDNFHPENSHVLPALMRRFHEAKVKGAKEVVVWGSGSPLREFLHVDDLADAVVFSMEKYSGLGHVNVGSGLEVTIKELAELVKEVVGFEGELVWDSTKPDGTPRKLMDSSKLAALGWVPKVSLRDGLVDTYRCMPCFFHFAEDKIGIPKVYVKAPESYTSYGVCVVPYAADIKSYEWFKQNFEWVLCNTLLFAEILSVIFHNMIHSARGFYVPCHLYAFIALPLLSNKKWWYLNIID